MKIWKFGGSSVATPACITKIIEILAREPCHPRAIVFSAFGGVTDVLCHLLKLATQGGEAYLPLFEELQGRHEQAIRELASGARQETALQGVQTQFQKLSELLHGVSLTEDVTDQTRDHVISFGELISNFIIHYALQENGIECEFLDTRELIRTDCTFGNAVVDRKKSFSNIQKYFGDHLQLQCVTGFIGENTQGKTTTLGRGGSDYTASILAAALQADLLEIWTDVDGVLTADPRIVPQAQLVPALSYTEAMELSHFGAQVLYPPTIQPVREAGIPLVVRNTFRPDCSGSQITSSSSQSDRPVTAISSIGSIALLTLQGSGLVGVPGSSGRLFAALARHGVNVILISQASSEHSICFAVNAHQAQTAESAVNREFALEQATKRVDPVQIEKKCAIISVVGAGMAHLPGVAGTLFSALGRNRINVVAIAQGSSEENISFVIQAEDESQAIQTIHRYFFEGIRRASVLLLGPGQVGSALLQHMSQQQEVLREQLYFDLHLVGVVRSTKALLKRDGMSWEKWANRWEETASPYRDINHLTECILNLHAPNLVVVDCTASDELAPLYKALLEKNIPVVGANKKVQTSSYATYQELRRISQQRKTSWRYETSVGAALPILSTVEDLLVSGDIITKIDAVLSGSLSYTFYQLQQQFPFSEIIAKASEKGYLEPDPRDDLGGRDFARKLLILSRLLGYQEELEGVVVEPLLPQSLIEAPSIEAFLDLLPTVNDSFLKRTEEASTQKKRLRYIGSIDGLNGRSNITLQYVGEESPFYTLTGTENLVVLYTERYGNQPLIVQGAGAGPEITASGVFSDLVHVLREVNEVL